MKLNDYLSKFREPMPAWLEQFSPGQGFPREGFFQSRVVYYPGSGLDGQAVEVFGSSHAAHAFVYADYGVTRERIEKSLDDERHGFRGYRCLERISLREQDVLGNGWTPHVSGNITRNPRNPNSDEFVVRPFGFVEVLEREYELDDEHGPGRLAILFLGSDGFATYDALFCQSDSFGPPFAILVQDHGFGGNYDTFGKNGLLEKIAENTETFPEFLLVGEQSSAWDGYERIEGVESAKGGKHKRELFRRSSISDESA